MSNSQGNTGAVSANLLLILSSPSGAGKTTLSSRLRETFPNLQFSVSHTTRKPRANEVDGREYHFIDRETFSRMVDDGQFVEWAHVHGNMYGTSVAEVERAWRQGKSVLFDVDYQGARQIRVRYPDAVGVFILPPSLDELSRRLHRRASDDEETIQRRLAAALGEIDHYGLFDYLVVNDDLDEASERLACIVRAEMSRRSRCAVLAERMLAAAHQKR